jgi:hypothetical protein
MQGFGRRKIKERLVLFLPSLELGLGLGLGHNHSSSSLTLPFIACASALCAVLPVLCWCSLDIFKDPKDHPGRARPYTAEQSVNSQVP